jgi:hypothetical protein
MRSFAVLAILATAGATAACGRTKLADGDDDGDDDPDAGPEEGTARITVLTQGVRAPAVATVVFFDAEGEVTEVTETDDDGVVSSTVLPGATAAAFLEPIVLPTGTIPQREARVVLGVAPGDDILLAGQRFNAGAVVATVELRLPDDVGATSFGVQTPCGFFAAPREGGMGVPVASLQFYESCVSDEFSYVAVAQDDTGPIKSLIGRGHPVDDMSTITVTDPWLALKAEDAEIESIPGEIGQLAVAVTRVVAGDDLAVDVGNAGDVVTDDDLSLAFKDVDGADASTLSVFVDGPSDINGFGTQRWTLRATGGGSRDIAAGDLVLPWIGAPAFDLLGRRVFWSQVGTGEWDATYVRLEWSGEIDGTETFGAVSIIGPPGVNAVALPTPPDDYLGWFPEGLRVNQSTVQLMESSELDGYDEARQRGLEPSFAGNPEELTGDGTVRHSFSPLPLF